MPMETGLAPTSKPTNRTVRQRHYSHYGCLIRRYKRTIVTSPAWFQDDDRIGESTIPNEGTVAVIPRPPRPSGGLAGDMGSWVHDMQQGIFMRTDFRRS